MNKKLKLHQSSFKFCRSEQLFLIKQINLKCTLFINVMLKVTKNVRVSWKEKQLIKQFFKQV